MTTEEDVAFKGEEEEEEASDIYAVQRILGIKNYRTLIWYLVQWEGYSQNDNTWVRENDASCDEAIAEFKRAMEQEQPGALAKMVGGTKLVLKGAVDPDFKIENMRKAKRKLQQRIKRENLKRSRPDSLSPKKPAARPTNKALSANTRKVAADSNVLTKCSTVMFDAMAESCGIQKTHGFYDVLHAKYAEIWPKVVGRVGHIKAKEFLCSLRESFAVYEPQIIACKKSSDTLHYATQNQLVTIMNKLDTEDKPRFLYVERLLLPSDSPQLDSTFNIACQCSSVCVGDCHNETPMYSEDGLYIGLRGQVIYECNDRCACSEPGSACTNRVVKKGGVIPLNVFKTPNRGWGVCAMSNIRKGEYIAEYVGEVLTIDEAVEREKIYSVTNERYIFGMDFDGEPDNVVDATLFGNVARMINHSCNPNLTIIPTFIESLDPKFYHLALFATRNIKKGEELTLDYGKDMLQDFECHCESSKCRAKLERVN